MMTQNFSFSRILPVWLVLFAFLCGMVLPSVAIARMEMAIAMEGDPGDGMDSAGGGGGGSVGSGIEKTPATSFNQVALYLNPPTNSEWAKPDCKFSQYFIPILVKGQLKFVVVQHFCGWGAIR